MKNIVILFIISIISLQAYAQKPAKNLYISKDQTYAKPNKDGSYGKSFTIPKTFASWKEIEEGINKYEGYNTVIKGTCESICQTKGCWLKVKTDEGIEYFVKFRDYAFFLPRDITGKTVLLNGTAFFETISVEELRHYAEDAHKSKEEIEAITEPKKQLRFECDGAFVLK